MLKNIELASNKKIHERTSLLRLGFVLALILNVMLISGCVTTQEDSSLLKVPSLPSELQEVRNVIDQKFDENLELISPTSGENNNSIQFNDLDNDGINEVMVFHKVATDTQPIKISVLSRNGENSWIVNNTIKGSGYDVNKVVYSDMDNDGRKEIIVGWQFGTVLEKGLTVYEYNKGEISEIFQTSYTEFTVDDFTSDGTSELVTIRLNRNEGNSTALLYEYKNKLINIIDETDMDGYINGYYAIKTGKAMDGKIGFFLDASLGAHSAFTDLLVYNHGELVNVFYNDKWNVTDMTYKAYPIKSRDIDEDGIIEIPILRSPLGYSYSSLSETPWITGWFKWDGENGIEFSNNSYSNVNFGFEYIFPKQWDDNITIEIIGKNLDTISFKEYSKNGSKEIFSIMTITSEEYAIEKDKLSSKGYVKFNNTFKNVYLYKKNVNYKPDMPYSVSDVDITENFQISFDTYN
ncbi:MAG: VCBS repeat-containing protein [Acidaminobacteraceae bacterium]